MIKIIKSNWNKFRRRRPEKSATQLAEEIRLIRRRSNILVITGMPYGNNWRGVYNSSVQMFPDAVLIVPHNSSQNVYPPTSLSAICDAVLRAKFEKVVFSGYGDCMNKLLLSLHYQAHNALSKNFYLIYHGSLSQHAEHSEDTGYLQEIIQLHQRGILQKIGFLKKGLSETLNKISGINSYFLINMVNESPSVPDSSFEGFNIGVFTHDLFRKNLHNQVAAALMFSEATVHVHANYHFEYLQSALRFRFHPFTESNNEFLQILGSMTLNFYVTFSECYGLVIAESLSLGVPCLASNSSGFFDYDDELRKSLVVEDVDNPLAIYQQANLVLQNRNEIAVRGKEYIKKLNVIAAEKLDAFLND